MLLEHFIHLAGISYLDLVIDLHRIGNVPKSNITCKMQGINPETFIFFNKAGNIFIGTTTDYKYMFSLLST